MSAAILLLAGMLALEDPPKDVIDFFATVASSLADAGRDVDRPIADQPREASPFLDHFDKSMPGYTEFASQIQDMLGAGEVQTSIDFVNTEGDNQKRTLDLDWVIQCEGETPKRAVIKCTIAKRGKKWKITSLAPIDFFKR